MYWLSELTGTRYMTTETIPHIWYSGGWKKKPSKEVPYNAIKITGTPQYEDKIFVSVNLVFTDYTLESDGCKQTIPELTLNDAKVQISAPIEETSPPSSPPEGNPDFTIKGWVALETNNSELFLRIRLSYGLEHSRQDELGYIMGFPIKLSSE